MKRTRRGSTPRKQRIASLATPADTGAEIRALRHSHAMTLETLAERAALSIGFPSLVARGLKKPSSDAMQRISKGFGVEVGWFVPPRPTSDPVERATVVRKAFRRRIDYSRLSKTDYLDEKDFLLSPSIEGVLALTLMTFEPGGHSGDDDLMHEGEEAGYVLKGELTLTIDGQRMRLGAGDSFGFPGSKPHRYANEGKVRLELILASTPVIMKWR